MNILLTLDRNYLAPLRVLLISMMINNPDEQFNVYIASDDLLDSDYEALGALCAHFGSRVHPIRIRKDWFADAPTIRYYSRAMYYRLLAAQLLPETLDRVLYLDPDMLITGSLRALYDTEMGEHLYAACIHKGLVDLSTPVNKIRLSAYESEGYFNSGMLLMNLPRIRKTVFPQVIFDYVRENQNLLVLPDQDVLNGLYGAHILALSELAYNYDARKYNEYKLATQGEADMDYVLSHTVIIHFCGKRKPWHRGYTGRFSALYKHYVHLAGRYAGA